MKLYRVFSQDVGENGFSGVVDIRASTPAAAVAEVPPAWDGEVMIALPYDRPDLWPNGRTGKVPGEALGFR